MEISILNTPNNFGFEEGRSQEAEGRREKINLLGSQEKFTEEKQQES
ncbi:MAG: hypothetical protein F6K54_24685 [Okeania sp. SIO3B5]|nr:hypothetical protein [Okeania sp. SIO3B5]NEO55983.1 hypothetical protein [Okeania sp. SIO3B5]